VRKGETDGRDARDQGRDEGLLDGRGAQGSLDGLADRDDGIAEVAHVAHLVLGLPGRGGGRGGREREDEQWKNASEGTAHATTKRQQKARHTKAHRRT